MTRTVAMVGVAVGVTARAMSATGLGDKLHGYESVKDFVASLQKPR